jgi:pilus assembly protein TadC
MGLSVEACCVNPVICNLFVALVFAIFLVIFIGLSIAFTRAVNRGKKYSAEEYEEQEGEESLR